MGKNSNSNTASGAGQGSQQASSSTSGEQSRNAMVKKSWGSYSNFMASYGLKMYNEDDVEEARRILDAFEEADRQQAQQQQQKKK